MTGQCPGYHPAVPHLPAAALHPAVCGGPPAGQDSLLQGGEGEASHSAGVTSQEDQEEDLPAVLQEGWRHGGEPSLQAPQQ